MERLSFPSGHSTVNAVLYGFLVFLVVRDIRPAARLPVILCAATLVGLDGVSRLYLGAHWLSDVAGGLAFGAALLSLLGMLYVRGRTEPIAPVGLLAVAVLALGLAGGANVYFRHFADVARYAAGTAVPQVPAADWWASDWQGLPAYRIDLFGEIEEPLTVSMGGKPAVAQGPVAAARMARSNALDDADRAGVVLVKERSGHAACRADLRRWAPSHPCSH